MNGRIEVYDVGLAKSDGKKLQSLSQNMVQLQSRLKQTCSQLREAWASDTQDANSYLEGIEKNVERLSQISDAAQSAGIAFEVNATSQEDELKRK